MSQADVDTIRRGYTDLNRRDVDAWLDAFHADAVMFDVAGGPHTPARQGHDGLRAWVTAMDEIWENGRHEPYEYIDAGDFVVVALRVRAHRRDVGVPFEMPLFHVFEMCGGKIQRGTAYLDKVEALEAVGLSE